MKIFKNKKKTAKEIDVETKILKAQKINKINLNLLVSDTRYLFKKSTLFQRIKGIFSKDELIQCVVHMPNKIDVVRLFPIIRKNVIDIGGTYYIYSPESVRNINGIPTLYFFYKSPYALLHTPEEQLVSFDADSFTQVQRSKFVEDVVRGAQEKPSMAIILILLGFVICIGISVFTLITTLQLKSLIGG